jgi:hypothetical protein
MCSRIGPFINNSASSSQILDYCSRPKRRGHSCRKSGQDVHGASMPYVIEGWHKHWATQVDFRLKANRMCETVSQVWQVGVGVQSKCSQHRTPHSGL